MRGWLVGCMAIGLVAAVYAQEGPGRPGNRDAGQILADIGHRVADLRRSLEAPRDGEGLRSAVEQPSGRQPPGDAAPQREGGDGQQPRARAEPAPRRGGRQEGEAAGVPRTPDNEEIHRILDDLEVSLAGLDDLDDLAGRDARRALNRIDRQVTQLRRRLPPPPQGTPAQGGDQQPQAQGGRAGPGPAGASGGAGAPGGAAVPGGPGAPGQRPEQILDHVVELLDALRQMSEEE